ncbi:NAD(P)/FAD-dependent oxidoreductase [Plantactinospora soyae]|uniref:2-polyprenyl-6-methoxyphenol hydroxylase-like FAD-dependent oxidoreductase n=1 Tax=Plantactinospora soyae TaxID=1544732 RepID=A0A927M5J9_9ACTN|nr:FAD-dependent monooxygenase [Plantactinospora soyae]MBE1488422.1 2-polyprenyl-6-methoxyphenol hydroxylase-like FAD-dependent oxidoreductase [Plantactinospora soyae]
MSASASVPRHAVVIGGSLAGLCIARTLLDHVERVTVVERDRFPDGPRVRAGVPQAHHLHLLLTSGQRALDRLFPGLMAELRLSGAVSVSAPTDVLYLSATSWRERFPATHGLIGASRELIDWTIRRRLLADERVRFLTAHEAVGLLPGEDGRSVAGVVLRPRGGTDGVERLDADLVVDASGHGSRTPDWLAALGYGRPEESRIDAGLGYASRRYVLPGGVADSWKHILLMPNPPQTSRGGVLYPIENDRWMVTLGGLGDEAPATDEVGFLAFARELRSPVLYEAIRDAVPDSPIHGFRWTANSRRHYETMARWPDGFLVVGDAACAFNPVYGQGMSVAAQTAALLAEHLRTHPGRFGRAAQAVVAETGAAAWTIATGADLRYATNGVRLARRTRFSHWYLARTADVANRDPYVNRTLTDVLYLVRPPAALMRPRMALRVLRGPTRPPLTTPPVLVPEPPPAAAR